MTFDRYQWYEVPGRVEVRKATFTWYTEPKMIGLGDTPTVEDGEPDVAEWPSISVYDTAAEKFADVGRYKVCFAKDADSEFVAIPASDGGLYLEIAAEDGDSAHPREVFSHQVLSGKYGQSNTFTLAGHRLYVPSTASMDVRAAGACGANIDPLFTATVDEQASTPDGYVFSVDVPHGEPGTFDVCYCESQADDTLDGAGKTYTVDSKPGRCSAAKPEQIAEDSVGLPKWDVAAEFQDHFCAKKCARGCVRQDCFCDSFEPDTMFTDEAEVADMNAIAPLCLSAVLCRDACTATANCTGFDYEPEKNFCWLHSSTSAVGCVGSKVTYDETKEAWT